MTRTLRPVGQRTPRRDLLGQSWAAFRARALADCAHLKVAPPSDAALAAEYIDRCGQTARVHAYLEVHQ